jgi:hypothetical protein
MNSFVKDMLMSQSRRSGDGRNPYGSRGGYVSNRRPRRDRDMEDMGMYGLPKGDYRRGGVYPMRDYNEYDMRHDYDMRMRDDYGRGYDYADYDMGRDYGEMKYGKLSHEDIEKWKRHLHNQDGTKGEHFKHDQISQAARQIGINPEEYGEHVFGLVMNMMYSDYCSVAKRFGLDRAEFYAELAKAFLNDKDFGGEPEEKVWLYYKCIAEKED